MPPTKQKSKGVYTTTPTGKKFIDIIDEFNNFNNCKTTDFIKRFTMLKERIESHNPSIDNSDLRWVTNILEELTDLHIDHRYPDRGSLKFANELWRKWSK